MASDSKIRVPVNFSCDLPGLRGGEAERIAIALVPCPPGPQCKPCGFIFFLDVQRPCWTETERVRNELLQKVLFAVALSYALSRSASAYHCWRGGYRRWESFALASDVVTDSKHLVDALASYDDWAQSPKPWHLPEREMSTPPSFRDPVDWTDRTEALEWTLKASEAIVEMPRQKELQEQMRLFVEVLAVFVKHPTAAVKRAASRCLGILKEDAGCAARLLFQTLGAEPERETRAVLWGTLKRVITDPKMLEFLTLPRSRQLDLLFDEEVRSTLVNDAKYWAARLGDDCDAIVNEHLVWFADTFITSGDAAGALRAEKPKFVGFLRWKLRNRMLTRIKQQAQLNAKVNPNPNLQQIAVASRFANEKLIAQMWSTAKRVLTPSQLEAFEFLGAGESKAAIARRLGISEAAVRERATRAVARLHRELADAD